MGSDIHIFAEYRGARSPYNALADGEFSVGRDYEMFAALAGVRAQPDWSPLVGPRGLPVDVSQAAISRYFLPVVGKETAVAWGIGEHCEPAEAERFIASGKSVWWAAPMTSPLLPSTNGHISNPDWHSASWLTLEEVDRALEYAGHPLEACPDEFQLLLVYLRAVAQRFGTETRIVFWFDN
jgi:hypothetical protein